MDMMNRCRLQNETRGLYGDLPIHTIGIGPELSCADRTMALGPPDMVYLMLQAVVFSREGQETSPQDRAVC